MAGDEEDPSVDARVNRSVRRFLTSIVLVLMLLAASAGWAYSGFPVSEYLGIYQLKPGQSAIILRLGRYDRTESRAGLRWHFPAPFEIHDIQLRGVLRVDDIRESEECVQYSASVTALAEGDFKYGVRLEDEDGEAIADDDPFLIVLG